MHKKKFILDAKNVINLEIKALQILKKILIIHSMMQLSNLPSVNQKSYYVVSVKVA